MSMARSLVAVSALGFAMLAPQTSQAATPDPDALRISAAGHSLKWNYVPQGKSSRYGHSEVLINASPTTVRDEVQRFSKYKEFSSRFKASNVVGHDGSATDVYLQIGVMKGFLSVYTSLRFQPPKADNGIERIEGTIIRGRDDRPSNVKDANVIWTIKQLDPNWTLLKCDILLLPDFPAPQGPLDEELRDAAQQGVDKIHDKAQGNNRWIPYNPF